MNSDIVGFGMHCFCPKMGKQAVTKDKIGTLGCTSDNPDLEDSDCNQEEEVFSLSIFFLQRRSAQLTYGYLKV